MEPRNPFSEFSKLPILLFAAFSLNKVAICKTRISSFDSHLRFIRKWGIICVALLSFSMVSWGQANYNWVPVGAPGDWQVAGNWNPNRVAPLTNDILIFNANGATTVTNVPTQTVGQIKLSGGSNVSLQSSGTSQLTIMGGALTDMDVPFGTTLQLSSVGANQIGIDFNPAGQTASIAGSLIINANGAFSNSFNTTNSTTTVTATGTLQNNGGVITSTFASLKINPGTYIHNRDGGAIPTADWNAGSSCNISGLTTTAPTGLGQVFGSINYSSAYTLTLTPTNTPSLSGNLDISPVGANIAVADQTVNLTGNLSGAGGLSFTTGLLNISGNYSNSGAFTAGTGTVNYTGVNQNVAAVTYYNLTMSNGGSTKTLLGNVTVNNDLTVTAGTLSFGTTLRTVNVAGNLSGAGTIDMSGGPVAHVLNLAGTNNAIGTLTTSPLAGSFVNYNGAGAQTIFGSPYYRNLTISTGGIKTLSAASTIGGDIIINNPASMAVSANITFNGTNLTNNSDAANSFDATAGTFTFALAGNQYINGSETTGAVVFYNLTAANGSTKTANLPFTVSSVLTINGGTILDLGTTVKTVNLQGSVAIAGSLFFNTTAVKTVNITGDLSGAGTITMTGALAHNLNLGGANNAIGVFNTAIGSGSTVNYNKAGSQQIFTNNNYQNLTISGGGTKTLQGNSTVNNIVNLNTGVLQLGSNNLTVSNDAANAIQGTFTSANMVETNSTGTLIRNGTATLPILYPVGSGGFYTPMSITALSGGTGGTINIYTVHDGTLGSNFVNRYWDINTSVTGKTITASFTYDPSEITIAPDNIWYRTGAGNWLTPAGTSSFGANSFTITGTTNMSSTSTDWTAGKLGTYYSYQTGDWNTPNTWTLDPSGTLQIGSSIPGINDKVVILTSRTVSLSSDNTISGLDITINAGGFINQTTYKFTKTLTALRGQGTLQLASVNFPTATTNTFINTGGGTTEYNNATDFTLPATTYNNLTINISSGPPAIICTQLNNLILNGNLYIKQGTFRINNNALTTPLSLTINGNVTVDNSGSFTVGNGPTNPAIGSVTAGGTAPFINYYTYFHTVIIKGNFTNNGFIRFTNLPNPVYNAFPSTSVDGTTGAASVYFQGATDNTLTCNGVTDFYNLILDKGTDQTYKLTINSSNYNYFRLFGANTLTGETAGDNANLRKALWIRTGTLVLQGSLIIPSLTEGITAGSPNSDFYIPSNGALILDGVDVIVLSTADNYQEINIAYGVSATDNGSIGVSIGGNSALEVYGKLQINNGYLSTRESGGIITSNVASGQLIINGGVVDSKQFLSSTGAAQYTQTAGTFYLRGRFQRTPTAYATIANLTDVSISTLNTSRVVNGISSAYGSFNLENTNNIFIMSGGTIRIYDVTGDGGAEQKAFDVKSSVSNINVTGGLLELIPVTGTVLGDAASYLVFTNAPVYNMNINRSSSSSVVKLSTPLIVQKDLNLTAGDFNANSFDLTIGGNFTLANGTTYSTGTNTTTLNGSANQTFTVNLAALLVLNKFTIDKPAGIAVNLAGTQTTLDINDNFRLVLGTLNDNGNTVNVLKDVFNSGLLKGSGKISFIGSGPQAIDGNGIFENVELNNNTGTAPVSLVSNMTIKGTLTFSQDKLFNIGIYNLKLDTLASIINGSATRYIQTAGNAGDGGLTRVYTAMAPFTFPVGAPTITPARPVKYTPATIGFSSAPTTYGSITVVPVGYEHPAVTVNGQSLTYFWRIKSSGFAGIAAGSVTHTFVYDQSDVVGTETNYIPSLFDRSALSWNSGVAANINTGTNTISDWSAPTNSKNYLDADYTAGDAAFGAPLKFYSIANSAWNLNTTWSYTSGGSAVPASVPVPIEGVDYPGPNSIVIIENNHTVNLTGTQRCASLLIKAGSVLDIYYYTGSVFSMVVSDPSGTNGLFRLTTPIAFYQLFTFPANSDFSDFDNNHGTTEFYDIDGTVGAEYILPANVTTYGNLILTAKGGDNLILPNNSATTIKGDLTCQGDDPNAWVTMSWLTGGGFYNPVIEKTVHVTGNMFINNGTFLFMDDLAPQHLMVDGNVTIAPGATFDVYPDYPGYPGTGPRLNSFQIGGSFINNSNNNPSARFKTGNNYVNLTFSGSTNASITSTGGAVPNTVFNNVVINKGTSQATTLTCNIGGTLSVPTPADNWLTLQNGTFIYNRTGDFYISEGTDFTIPPTAGLTINTPSNVYIANNAANNKTLFLNGKLTILNGGGNVYVGPVGNTTNNADIEYSGSGASTINIQGGTLIVNGQIRRPALTTNGILSYTQSGGIVIINGNNALATKAKLEVLNSGSEFDMSAGTLTIVRGGGTTFGDLYLRPGGSTVTGGTIVFANASSGAAQSYGLDANVPLYNITVTGTGSNAAVGLMVSPLVLKGTLTLSNANSIFNTNNINVSIAGDMNNSGTYNYGTNLTTFNGGTQSITGSTVTNFYDLNFSPSTSLTVNNNFTVNRNLTIGSGNLILGTAPANKKITLLGDLTNNGSFTDNNTTGGISLAGSSQQQITGTGAYGRLELNNSLGAKLNNDITLQNDLVLTLGVLDINANQLTLSQNSLVGGAPFGLTKMITSDGVISSFGVRKFFNPGAQTFTFPVGVAGKYTPAIYTITASAAVGSIKVNPINSFNPSVIDPSNVLNFYWKIQSSGISGLTGNVVLQYMPGDVNGAESNYVAALLVPPASWYKAAPGPATDNVNEATHQITFNYTISNDLNGEYTAGIFTAIPGVVPSYQSNADGFWKDRTKWDPVGGSPPCLDGGPNGANVIVNNVITVDNDNIYALSTTINNELKVISPFSGHNLGNVSGNGIIYLQSGNLPGGDFTSFIDCAGNGAIEYGGTGTYTVIATLFNSLPNMFFSGTGTRVLPNKDLTICHRFVINGPTVDNSVNNKKLTIQGTMERLSGTFTSGSGVAPAATVTFAGTAAQTFGGPALTGDFSGTSKLNNLEINNAAGLNIGASGQIEVNNSLLLTNGIISTTGSNKLSLLSTSSAAVVPNGGSASSFVNGPLIKYMVNGGTFLYPIGKGSTKGHNFTLTSTAGSTLPWTAEYFTPNTTNLLTAPLQAVNSTEEWSVNTTGANTAKVKLGWDPTSNLTPLMTLNGIIDMRVAELNGGTWNEVVSTTTGDDFNGDVESTGSVNLDLPPKFYTIASVTSTKARAFFNPSGPICGAAPIPLGFASFYDSGTLSYTINGGATQTYGVTPATASLPTSGPGAYKLTGFTYSSPVKTGVVDGTVVIVYSNPMDSHAGLDQSLCGVSGTGLLGNNPNPYSGLWSIINGAGGTVVTSNQYNSVFTGVLGNAYTLRWTISNGLCTSSDDVAISFPVVAAQPDPFTSSYTPVCQNTGGYIYTVTPVAGNTYNWSCAGGSGWTITPNGIGNSATIDFSSTATSGTLQVTASNGCGASAPRTMVITVNPNPTATIAPAIPKTCEGIGLSLTASPAGGSGTYTTHLWTGAGASSLSSVSIPNPIFTNATAGSYALLYTVTDDKGCIGTASKTVTVNPLPVPVINGPPNPICVGSSGNTYSTALFMSGYVWNVSGGGTITGGGTGFNSVTITWNTAGAQGVTVSYTDGNGCTAAMPTIYNVTITPNNTVTLSSAVGTDAQTVCINTPITNITYSTTGATGATVTNLPTGVTGTWLANVVTISGTPTVAGAALTYTVTLTGGCGVVTATGTIIVNPVPTVTITNPVAVCSPAMVDLTTGAITAGSTAGLTYTYWTDALATTALTAPNAVAISGTYYIKGTVAATGCYDIKPVLVTVNPLPLAPIVGVITQPTCATATGSVTLSGLPVAGTWTVTESVGSTTITGTGTTGNFNGLAAGTYTFTVTNAAGCTSVASGNAVINVQPATPTAPVVGVITQPTCGVATGSVSLSGLPAAGTWTVTESVGSTTITGTGTTGTFSGLSANTYTFTVTDGITTCTSIASGSAVINVQPATPTSPIVGAITQPTCATATGNVSLSGLPAAGTWTVTESVGSTTITGTGTTGTFSGLSANTYTFKVTDGITTCTSIASGSAVINVQPATPTAPTVGAITQPTCGVAKGSVSLSGLPAAGTWTIKESVGSTTITGTGTAGTFNGLSANTYTFKVTDGITTCTSIASGSAVINAQPTPPAAPTASTTIQPTCAVATGTIVVTAPVGAGYEYNIDGGAYQASVTFAGKTAGSHNILVRSTADNTCISAPTAVTVNAAPTPLSATSTKVNVSCFGATTGSATATAAGGTGPYTYSWNTSPVQTTATATGLAAGIYKVTITDANICTIVTNDTITQPAAALAITTTKVNVSCFGGATGSATATAAGGTWPYTYSWNTLPVQTTATASGLSAITYTVTVIDANSCTATTNVTITQPAAALTVTTTRVNVACFGGTTGSATASPAGGTGPYTYSWNTIPVQTTATATGLGAATYIVTVKDANNCVATANVIITQPAAALYGTTVVANVLCSGGHTGAINLTVTGGTTPYTFLWSNSATTEDISSLTPGSYSVKVTDANGCFINSASQVTEPAKLSIEEAHHDATCPGELDGSITLTITGGIQPYTIIWSDGSNGVTRSATDTTYSVVVTDANGCAASLNIVVGFSEGSRCVFIPQVITPNGDGKNDTWIIKNVDLYPNAEVLVYNRWGELIFQTKNVLANPWDGRYRGKLVPVDSYHYILDLHDGSKPKSGVISVIR